MLQKQNPRFFAAKHIKAPHEDTKSRPEPQIAPIFADLKRVLRQ
ncbi:MAG: hypothetical protein GQF41_2469 [Candidatus Rifleibacterium amylolyticum]|nr:MAG: hypothetical protein GQF41_2469 [Candidatus Rifleibacterium amylolyticum]